MLPKIKSKAFIRLLPQIIELREQGYSYEEVTAILEKRIWTYSERQPVFSLSGTVQKCPHFQSKKTGRNIPCSKTASRK